MKLGRLIWTGVTALVLTTPALAEQSVEDRLAGMEKRIQYLEQRGAEQDNVIVEKDRQIAEATGQTEWAQGLEISGAIEIEAVYDKPAGEESTSSVDVDTAEVGIAAEVNDWTSAELVLAYDVDAKKVDVDSATATLGPPDGPWSLTAGKLTLPFGTYETGMISDPVTLELGETDDVAAVFEVSSGGLSASLFGLHGESEKFENFGVSADYSVETGTWPSALRLNVSYIHEIRSDQRRRLRGFFRASRHRRQRQGGRRPFVAHGRIREGAGRTERLAAVCLDGRGGVRVRVSGQGSRGGRGLSGNTGGGRPGASGKPPAPRAGGRADGRRRPLHGVETGRRLRQRPQGHRHHWRAHPGILTVQLLSTGYRSKRAARKLPPTIQGIFRLRLYKDNFEWAKTLLASPGHHTRYGRPSEASYPMSPAAVCPYFKRDITLLGLGLLLAFLLGIDGHPYAVPSEARYIEIPRQMVDTGDWITPRLNGVKYFEKPPLFYWVQAAQLTYFGLGEFSGRFWTAITTLALCLVTSVAAYKRYGRLEGVLSPLILASCILVYFSSRVVLLDAPVSLFLVISLFSFMFAVESTSGRKRDGFLAIMYASAALATLTKGLIGIVIPAMVIGSWIALTGRWQLLRSVRLLPGSLLFLLVAGPWHYLAGRETLGVLLFLFLPRTFRAFFDHNAWSLSATMVLCRRPPRRLFALDRIFVSGHQHTTTTRMAAPS